MRRNIKSMNEDPVNKACAVCKFYYARSTAVSHKAPTGNFGDCCYNEEPVCVLYGIKTNGNSLCRRYESKFPK